MLFRITYDWHNEPDKHHEVLLDADITTDQFKQDLLAARDYAYSRLYDYNATYVLEYTPQYYKKAMEYLQKHKQYKLLTAEDNLSKYTKIITVCFFKPKEGSEPGGVIYDHHYCKYIS